MFGILRIIVHIVYIAEFLVYIPACINAGTGFVQSLCDEVDVSYYCVMNDFAVSVAVDMRFI